MWRGGRALDAEGRNRLAKLVKDRAPLRLEAAALGGCETVGWKREVPQVGKHRAGAGEPLPDLLGARTARRDASRGAHPRRRISQERRALVLALERAIDRDERERLARPERVRLDRPNDALLLAASDAHERVGDARADRAGVDPALDRGREVEDER